MCARRRAEACPRRGADGGLTEPPEWPPTILFTRYFWRWGAALVMRRGEEREKLTDGSEDAA